MISSSRVRFLRTVGARSCCMVVLGLALPAALASQRFSLDGGAGFFAGARPTYNGPVFHVRASAAVRPPVWLGVRATYRDDDPSSGRAQSVALLGEAHLVFFGRSGAALYVPAGIGVEWMRVTTTSTLPPGDAKSGAYMAADIGLGVEVNGSMRRLLIEGRQSFRIFGNSRSLSVGLRSYATGVDLSSAALDLAASTLEPSGRRYARDRDYQGYVVGYVRPLSSRFPTDIRFSLGIDFLEFTTGSGSWSTGSIALAVGAGYRVATFASGKVTAALVSYGGLLHYAEPGGRAPSPLIGLGGEVRMSPGPLGVVAGYQAMVAGGPAGTLTATQLRLGMAMRL